MALLTALKICGARCRAMALLGPKACPRASVAITPKSIIINMLRVFKIIANVTFVPKVERCACFVFPIAKSEIDDKSRD